MSKLFRHSGFVIFVLLFFTPSFSQARRTPIRPTISTQLTETSLQSINETGYWIEVQIPQRKLVLAKGKHIVKTFPIAVGDPKFPSPIGLRTIEKIIWNPWWIPPKESSWVTDPAPVPPHNPDNPLGEIKIPLGDSYLIHGTRVAESIGQWASHGCFRMLFEDLFGLVQILSKTYANESALDSMNRANTDKTVEFEVLLKNKISISIVYEPIIISNDSVYISPDFYGIFSGNPTAKKSNKHEGLEKLLSEMLQPYYIKNNASPNFRKIKNALRTLHNQTIQIPLKDLI